MSGRGAEYDKRDKLVTARDGYATTLAASTLDANGKLDYRIKMMDLREELRFLPST